MGNTLATEHTVRIGSFNSLNTLHGLMWWEEATLNEAGKSWKERLEAESKTQPNPRQFLSEAVQKTIKSGEGYDLHTWSTRSVTQRTLLESLKLTAVGLQEVHYDPPLVPSAETVRECKASLNDILPKTMTVTNYSKFGLFLGDPDMEAKLNRGNAVIADLSKVQCVDQFTVNFEKQDGKKKQTRRVACSVFETGDNNYPLRFSVCSHQTSGYDSRGYSLQEKDAAKFENFKTGYLNGNAELDYYLRAVDAELVSRKVDVNFFAGDVNQCAITHDNVNKVGLETRREIFEKNGYTEDPSFKDPTSNFGRAMDRIAWKVFADSKFKVVSSNVTVPAYPEGIDPKSVSDHRIVVGEFVIKMD